MSDKAEAQAIYAPVGADHVEGCSKVKVRFESGKTVLMHATIMSDQDVPDGWTTDVSELEEKKAKRGRPKKQPDPED